MAVSDEPKKSAVSVQVSYVDIVAWLQANWTRYWEWASYGVIVLFAAGFRLWGLGERSLNHDESLHATYSWYLYLGRGYTHDPMMHGPFQFFMNAFMWKTLTFVSSAPFISAFAHWGPSDYTARLSYALFGTAFVLLPFLLRNYIGRTGALFAALFIAFSPVIVYFNRFARGDTYMAIWTLGIVVCMWRYMMDRRPLYLYLIAGLLALSFATKEVSFLIVAMFLLFLDLLFAWEIVDHVRSRGKAETVAPQENPDAGQSRRTRRKEQLPPAQPKEQHSDLWWTGFFICVVPVAWLLAIVWPFLEKLRGQWKMDKWPVSGDLLIIVGTLAGVQFAAGVQMLPFIGDKGYYLDSGVHEDTLMKMTVFLFLAVSAYIGLLWRPRTWLTAAAVFYAIFILFYTTFFTNIGGLTFAEKATGWPQAFGVIALLAFVGPSLSLLFLPESLSNDSEYKPLERTLIAGAALGLVLFVGVFVFVLADTGFWSGTWGSFDYWLQQQNVQRGDQPVYYYLMLLPMYDFLPLVFALAGAAWLLLRRQFILSLVAVLAVSAIAFAYFAIHPSLIGMFPVLIVLGLALFALRLDIFDAFLVFWAGGAMIAFATAGEKMPWLTLHMTVPIIILAARSLGALYERFRVSLPLRWGNPEVLVLLAAVAGATSMSILWISGFSSVGAVLALVLGVVAAGLVARALMVHGRLLGVQTAAALLVPALFVFTVRDTIRANFDLGSWPREILSYADTSPGIPRARDQLVGLAKESGLGRKYPIVVDNELAWPMVWYLRDYSPTWASSTMSPPTTGSIVILKSGHESWMEPYLDQYQTPVSIRHLWWFGDGPQYYQGINAKDFAKSLFNKGDWNVWRNYFVWRQVPWEPPPNDTLVYIPKPENLATEGGATLTPPPSIPTITVKPASQAVIGAGKLNEPTDVTLDAAGNIYVSDGKNNRIQEFSSDGTLLRTLQPAGDDAFVEPWSVAVGADGSIYVSDTWHYGANGRVAKYDANLNLVWTTKQEMGLYGPRDLTLLPDGNLLVADTGNKRIIELSSSTGDIVDMHGGDGSGPGQFNEPVGLAIGPNGDIYVADTWNGRVQHFDSSFKYLGEFTVKGWGSTEVTAKPYLAVLSDGRVIVGNPANGRIELYNQQGQPVVAWELPAASTGAKGRPVGIALDGAALLYVADCAGNQVYRLPVASLTGP